MQQFKQSPCSLQFNYLIKFSISNLISIKKTIFQRNFKIKKRKAITYSPVLTVPSAQLSLTSLFGMGRGVPQRYHHFKYSIMLKCIIS